MKGLAKEHICITQQTSVVIARVKAGGGLGRGEQKGENGDICNSVNNKKCRRKKEQPKRFAKAEGPNLFGTRDRFHGRQFFHGPAVGG